MKICPKCNTGNDNHAVTCKDCGNSLAYVDKEDRDFLAEVTAREKKKHRKIMRIHKVFLPIAVLMYAFFVFIYLCFYSEELLRGKIYEF